MLLHPPCQPACNARAFKHRIARWLDSVLAENCKSDLSAVMADRSDTSEQDAAS